MLLPQNVQGPTIEVNEDYEESYPVSNQSYSRPLLYTFPELDPSYNIDFENLYEPNRLLILCVESQGKKKAFVWRGLELPSDIDDKDYLEKVLKHKWPEESFDMIEVQGELPDEESDEFVGYFDE